MTPNASCPSSGLTFISNEGAEDTIPATPLSLKGEHLPTRAQPSGEGRAPGLPPPGPGDPRPHPASTYLAAPALLPQLLARPTWGSGYPPLRNFRQLRAGEPASPGITQKGGSEPGGGWNGAPVH